MRASSCWWAAAEGAGGAGRRGGRMSSKAKTVLAGATAAVTTIRSFRPAAKPDWIAAAA